MDKMAIVVTVFPRPSSFQLTVWMSGRFTLSLRDVEELLAERGLDGSYETVHRRFLEFGQVYAAAFRLARHRSTDRWYLDETVTDISSHRIYLWRAVDSEGEALDFLVQRRQRGPVKPASRKLGRGVYEIVV